MTKATLLTLACGLCLIGMTGCGPEEAPPTPATPDANSSPDGSSTTEAFTHTIKLPVEYYTGGPQQSRPPDGELAAGVKARILEESGSYTLIRTETGIEAYVSSDALQPVE